MHGATVKKTIKIRERDLNRGLGGPQAGMDDLG
jgi:hypothetical protein